jgi:hypothetical protein
VAALVLLLDNATTTPPDGAAAESVAVPCAFALPPVTLVGEIDSDESVGVGGVACALTVNVPVRVTPP